MNYLAHLYLSCDDEDLLIGNFIADSISNKAVESFSEAIQKGIQLHRQIDSFTDQHPMVLASIRRLQPYHHKYAPVVVDVLYDHLLAVNWDRYSGESLDSFAQTVYQILEKRLLELPIKMQKRVPIMIQHEWLQAYATKKGMEFTLGKLDERTRFPSDFRSAMDHLKMDFDAYNQEFNAFFPDIIQFVQQHCAC